MYHIYSCAVIPVCTFYYDLDAGISKLLSDTGRELNAKFDRISFRNVFDSIVDNVNQMARKCGELDQRAKQLCSDLRISIEEVNNLITYSYLISTIHYAWYINCLCICRYSLTSINHDSFTKWSTCAW